MKPVFSLHSQLAADTIMLLDWTLCQVLLMNDSQYPWLILVPKRTNISELMQLSMSEQHRLLHEINCASKALQNCNPTKLNIATLGNVVTQLHVHIIARFNNDCAWPKPVWGYLPAKPYPEIDKPFIVQQYRQWLSNCYAPD